MLSSLYLQSQVRYVLEGRWIDGLFLLAARVTLAEAFGGRLFLDVALAAHAVYYGVRENFFVGAAE